MTSEAINGRSGLRAAPGSATKSGPQSGPAHPNPTRDIAVVIITQATRPAELDRAIASVRSQKGVDSQLVLLLNGAPTPMHDPSDVLIELPENVGIPAGRNAGAAAANARLVVFLDDDAELLGPSVLASVVARFADHPRLGAMAIRLIDEHGQTQRRHIPRLGSRSAARPGQVTYVVGAACAVRMSAFDAVGGFDSRFFYAMEESDLAWRILNAGWSIWYAADLTAFHPRTAPSRHPGYVRMTARNRLWMAWRSLPAPLLGLYLLTWTVVTVARGGPAGEVAHGYREACSSLPRRSPMRWRTVLRMTRIGRPPVI